WGPSTGTDPATTEAAMQLPPATAVLPSGATPVAIGPAVAGGDLPIGAGQVVLSGRGPGAAAVAQLASHAAVLNVDLGGTAAAIGGSPQLLQGGQIWFPTDNRDDFTQGRHARTMVGLTSNGEMLLVTADGAGPGSGLTLVEAARLMSGLGAVDALNLDGGGSSTFVGTGTVRSHPSDGAERPVASALTVLTVVPGPVDPVAALLTQVTNALNGLLAPPG
ncbi:MAG TPA: phosphodiester glycosidase family protein, partial [Acidimicrobiales bacterium]|nr:phosphodiester glycosidase family protein [Acidimicrobiales bacterium]